MQNYLAKFHLFEKVQLLFYNENKHQLYTLYKNALLNKNGNIQIISFPSEIGVSGEVVYTKKIHTKDYNGSQIFNNDIDNTLSIKDIRNYIFLPLFNSFGKFNGILQFFNKCKVANIHSADINDVKTMERVYGLLIEIVNEKENIMNMLLGLKCIVEMLSGKLAGNDNGEEDLSQIDKLRHSVQAAIRKTDEILDSKRDEKM